MDLDFTAMDNQPPIKPTFKATILKLRQAFMVIAVKLLMENLEF